MSTQCSKRTVLNPQPSRTEHEKSLPKPTPKVIKYKPTYVGGSKNSVYSVPITFQHEDPKQDQSKFKKRNNRPYTEHVMKLKTQVKASPSKLTFLSNWSELLKTWGSSSMARVDLFYLISLSGISLDRANPRDRMFVAQCLQSNQAIPDNHKNLLLTSKEDIINNNNNNNNNIFPLLERATEAYFNRVNPYNPYFTKAGFFNKPRSKLLRLCVWRVGLQFLPTSELLVELCENINQQIISRIVPSAITFELGTLQGLVILSLGLYDFSLNRYRGYIFHCASLVSTCLGLFRVSPGPINQERTLTMLTLGYNQAQASNVSKTASYTLLPSLPLKTKLWPPKKVYSNPIELFNHHPNHHLPNSCYNDLQSATLDATIATLSFTTYHFDQLVHHHKTSPNLKSHLQRILAWGTNELQASKILQLSDEKFIPLASCPQSSYSDTMLANFPESNRIIAQLQLVLHCRFHHKFLSTSDPYHLFRLIDLLKLTSSASSLFSRLTMLLDAARCLLLLERTSKVELYLTTVRTCLHDMVYIEKNLHYAYRYLLLFDALVARATTTPINSPKKSTPLVTLSE